uniref:sphingolipid 4-desaturase n=1 Tax=Brachionus koreanus TaxID=1199090 RepID=A0A291LM80_9BILA|nr:delta-4 desaturase 1 [Brachionus koreanus]QBO56251.1 fatty acid desaturase 4-2 [Brachionus koreanus]
MMLREFLDFFRSNKNDFYWEATDEPHASRRKQILAKYPQIKKLMGHDPRISIQLTIMVFVQLCMSYLVRNMSWMEIIFLSYVVGGTLNHSLSLGLHEVAHNLAFGAHRPFANRLIGFFANLPLGVPASITFRKYHLDHHKYQGDELIDVDLPTKIEGILFSSTIGKFVFIVLQPLFYCLRPVIVLPKKMTFLEILNWTIQVVFDCIIFYTFGIKSLAYLWLGTLLGLGLHPIAGHFIAEHYVFIKGFETYSYYGPLNLITFNVGYHNEHHDFPNIPGYRLPEVKKIAPEFYDNLPCHHSWIKVLYDFITCTEMGPYARVKRKTKYTREWAKASDRQSMLDSKTN